jgi:hypothetical protein
MPRTRQQLKADFIAAPAPTLANELLDRLVAFEPLRQEVVDTKLGPSEAVIARVIQVNDDGSTVDHGESPVFWLYVRRQLLLGVKSAKWVVGRLIKNGQAFMLETPSESDERLITEALDRHDVPQ